MDDSIKEDNSHSESGEIDLRFEYKLKKVYNLIDLLSKRIECNIKIATNILTPTIKD